MKMLIWCLSCSSKSQSLPSLNITRKTDKHVKRQLQIITVMVLASSASG